jgi:hypothetical protein
MRRNRSDGAAPEAAGDPGCPLVRIDTSFTPARHAPASTHHSSSLHPALNGRGGNVRPLSLNATSLAPFSPSTESRIVIAAG